MKLGRVQPTRALEDEGAIRQIEAFAMNGFIDWLKAPQGVKENSKSRY